MECDICSGSAQGGQRLKANAIRQAVDAGYNPFVPGHPGNLGMLSAALGLSPDQGFADWRARVARDASDWLVCPLCHEALKTQLAGIAPQVTPGDSSVLKAIGYYLLALLASAFAVLGVVVGVRSGAIHDLFEVDNPITILVVGGLAFGIPALLIWIPLANALDMTRELSRRRRTRRVDQRETS